MTETLAATFGQAALAGERGCGWYCSGCGATAVTHVLVAMGVATWLCPPGWRCTADGLAACSPVCAHNINAMRALGAFQAAVRRHLLT